MIHSVSRWNATATAAAFMVVLFVRVAGRAGLVDGLLHLLPRFTGSLLDAADQFALLAFNELKIVIGELGPLLFQFAFDDIPVAFHFQRVHKRDGCGLVLVYWRARRRGASRLIPLAAHMPFSLRRETFCKSRGAGFL
jgi:hypothetical protein